MRGGLLHAHIGMELYPLEVHFIISIYLLLQYLLLTFDHLYGFDFLIAISSAMNSRIELPTQNFDLREIWAFFQGVFNFFKGGL